MQPEWVFRTDYDGQDIEDEATMRARYQARDRLRVAQVCLWLARPSAVSMNMLVDLAASDAAWTIRHFTDSDPLVAHPDDAQREPMPSHYRQARELNSLLGGIPLGSSIGVAVYNLMTALTTRQWRVRYPLLWIALEALFAPAQGGEATHQLCQRLAFFLKAPTPHEVYPLFQAAKGAYRIRSDIVHGRAPKETEWLTLLRDAETWVRESLVLVLSSTQMIKTFNDNERRERALTALVFPQSQNSSA